MSKISKVNALQKKQEALEKAKMESKLYEKESLYQLVIRATTDAVWDWQLLSNCIYWNEGICKLFGYTLEDIDTDVSWRNEKIHPEDREKILASIHATIDRKDEIWSEEYRFSRKDGSHAIVIDRGYIVYDGAGKAVRMVGTMRDITERKLAEKALRESEEHYRKFFEEDLAGDFISSPEGKLLACNPAFAKIFGFPSVEEASKYDLNSLFPNENDREAFFVLLQKKKKIESHEIELRRLDHKPVHVVANVVGSFDKNNNLTEVKGYIFDNTTGKNLEEQLRQSQKMEAMGGLAGGIAHDFNNLLTIIKGYSDLLMARITDENPLRKNVKEIAKAAERASLLTRQLLAFSRKQMVQFKILNINAIVTDVEQMLRHLIGEDVELIVSFEPNLGLAKVDRGQVEQVIVNLVVNARDSMPRGGKLTIKTANVDLDENDARQHVNIPAGPYIMLSITDTGSGMSPEILSHIFEPFFTTKEQGKGTGLGLSTVYGIIQQSSGSIRVESEPEKGSTFKIYLPRTNSPESMKSHTLPPSSIQGNETILLVEDDEGLRALAVEILQSRGYRIITAQHPGEALKISQNHKDPIHLMVTDVVMPQMSGHELVRRMVHERPKMKVLYMSGYTPDTVIQHDMSNPNTPFLQKPFMPDIFIRKVREILDTPLDPKYGAPHII